MKRLTLGKPLSGLLANALLSFAVFVTGCASIDSTKQAVLISSDPPGADIIVKDEDEGSTNRFVMVPRERKPVIRLKTDRETVNIPLKTRYRWTDSFFKNFVFWTLAPIGWTVDLLTGAAWDIEDPKGHKIAMSKGMANANEFSSSIAIAPPQAEVLGLSDAGAAAVEEALKTTVSGKFQILPYRQTLSQFIGYQYDFDGKPAADDMRDIYYTLGTHEVFESKIEEKNGRLILTGQTTNGVTKKTHTPLELTLHPNDNVLESLYVRKGPWGRLMPNALGLDFVSQELTVTRQGAASFGLVPEASDQWWASALSYLSAINISNLPSLRQGRAGRWLVTFVPSARISRLEVRSNAPDIPEQRFIRWWLSGGYGPEFGYQKSRHYVYLSLIPNLYYSAIYWRQSGTVRERTGTGIAIQTEVGYLYFFSDKWSIRGFVRNNEEDSKGWQEALAQAVPNTTDMSTRAAVAGITIAYRFEPSLDPQRWKKASSESTKP
jgi:hypothetical protein